MTTGTRWLNEEEQELWRLLLGSIRKINRGMEETLMSGSVVEMELIEKQPSTITPKEPDSVNNIEEE